MSKITLDIEGYDPVEDPTAEYVARALEHITPRGPSVFILTRADGSFVQTAGSRIRLSVEARYVRPEGFRHLIVGVEDEDTELTTVVYSCGSLDVQKCEVLRLRDAQIIFDGFLRTGQIPAPYIVRDVTNMFEDAVE